MVFGRVSLFYKTTRFVLLRYSDDTPESAIRSEVMRIWSQEGSYYECLLYKSIFLEVEKVEGELTEACKLIKSKGAFSLAAIGTSQESSDSETICEIALPENIMTLPIAIRGKRWTYHKIVFSINR